MRVGNVFERRAAPDRSWTALLSRVEEVAADQLPPGVMSGVRARLPMIVVPEYLSWLRAQLSANGVSFSRRTVGCLNDLVGGADLVVIAAGIHGGELLGGDPDVYPVRGQIVRLTNPGLNEWVTDDDHPEGVTYVFPRNSDVIIGGTAIEGSWDTKVHPDVEAAIINRAQHLVPALRGQAILGRAAGLRPARATVRVELIQSAPLATIAAYGHGGAGFTLSWGTAERVRALSNL